MRLPNAYGRIAGRMPLLRTAICRIFRIRGASTQCVWKIRMLFAQMKNKQFYFYSAQRPKHGLCICCVCVCWVFASFGDHKMEISISWKWAFLLVVCCTRYFGRMHCPDVHVFRIGCQEPGLFSVLFLFSMWKAKSARGPNKSNLLARFRL